MSKNDVLMALNSKKKQLEVAKERLKTLNNQYDAISELSSQCKTRFEAFSNTIAQRNKQLIQLDSITDRVKTARRYKSKMFDLLNGKEYQNTTKSIDDLLESVSQKMRAIVTDIQDTEEEISILQINVEKLQYEYDTYPEEVNDNG